MKTLDLDVLAMVVAVADAGSFVRGAALVHRSQAALSMQIRALEETLGKPLFIRAPRNVTPTPDGHTLIAYARRMLALRDEAWATLAHPEVTGRVSIGMPDDYASSLLPPVLRKFSANWPKVEIQVVGLPSSALAPLVRENKIDLACITGTTGTSSARGLSGEFIRFEPMVWAGPPAAATAAIGREVWRERPLPIALFSAGSVARANAIQALERARITYRTSYESPSLMGLCSMVAAGLAVAPLARCAVPETFATLGRPHGLPDLPELEVVLARSASSNRPPCDFLAEQILAELRV
ncbi:MULTISPECIES: LysR substrate-binding domain-containing protein [Paraburkholderia]|jgi:DNA-binding transcriptional LysR family regulator|uniref:LysR family transcriptional regulator n=1 Tax=Paraburkholderia tropica TaxID=92647 RepID=A0A1A5XA61_9BURK|nr:MULTISPECIES: LysR substrate-binding domain-containing protein [Paraburkholderia]MBB2982371.1 DNA-binding transcriptional LysR family regulator [Paraburkholderia tropica]MBB2999879.1 DNA-binding transcriptional LysR family regulator [Paraburkholderia tropica]MBB6319510.1 DNA-binding transcriptional LysR family regulator [Paraburkholderia tropica]MBN3812844.1 LysR family transcriptional regulator [Paraburkholderia sp. Ac-20347]MDE1142833.1 LysR substrate-binding domain-containing protein [Pa